MAEQKWNVTFLVNRQKGDNPGRLEPFQLEVNPDEYVLDAIERIWAFHDRTLCFRHACHHSVCGACGMRVNGVEKLTCITHIKDITKDGGTVKVEPLRHFPVESDLVIDMAPFYSRLEAVHFPQVVPLNQAPDPDSDNIAPDRNAPTDLARLVDCIECAMCISACPVPLTDSDYQGPAILAAIQHQGIAKNPDLLPFADSKSGAWRCHSAFECSEVCPSNVDPGWRIMDLRKQVVTTRIKNLFRSK
jgi:succinate dehydrogenase / fumarate reductase iron-sulfur subunit